MLKWITNMKEISFPMLMEVYAETNRKTACVEWPELPEGFAIEKAERDFYDYLRNGFFRTDRSVYALWEVNGKYVSALRLEPYRDGLLIEALETAPLERRKGYGFALVQAVVCHIEGTKLYSHVEKQNKASLALHERCGFEKISDCAVYIDGSVNYRGCTMCFQKDEE